MKFYFILVSVVLFAHCKPNDPSAAETAASENSAASSRFPVLTHTWETSGALKTPESVLYDRENNLLYVSCINGVPPTEKDNDGFIAMVSTDGKIITERWVRGLHAPKGMGILGASLIVTDIDRLVAIDRKTGKMIKTWPVKGAQFLNDIVTTPDGVVYFTDSNTSTIYKLELDKVSEVKADTTLGGTNGICFHDGKLFLAAYISGDVHRFDPVTGEVTTIARGIPGGDGIVRFGNGFLVSNWNGEVYYVTDAGEVKKVLDTQAAKMNAADICLLPDLSYLLVPTFFGNTVAAYQMTLPL